MTINVAPNLPTKQPPRSKVTKPVKAIPAAAVLDDLVLWRLSVKQYHALAAAGILDEDDRVELLDGLLVDKMSKNPPHSYATQQTSEAMVRLLPGGWFINVQEPVTLDTSEPEPDLAVVAGRRSDFRQHHPKPQEVALVVEVADSTLARDRGTKKRIYAQAGIPVYWVINLIDQCIELYTEPSGPAKQPDYLNHQRYQLADEIPVVIGDQLLGSLKVRELLP
jgi:Uma2 family endonuclease